MISLVTTVYNDREGVEAFFHAMAAQTLLPDEIVITDAGSNDGTWELILEKSQDKNQGAKVIALQEKKCNVARGRNLAIEKASGDLIVSTDIGCEWDPEWVEELVKPLLNDSQIDLLIGSWAVKHESLHEEWAMTEWALKGDQKLNAQADSYSSSRSIAYRKQVWEKLGKYPEDLTFAGDDAAFHYMIENAGISRMGAPIVRCYWHRHETLKAFLKESYRYGVGEGEGLIHTRAAFLIGGRLLMEPFFLLIGMPLLFWMPPVGLALIMISFLSFFLRCWKLLPATRRLAAKGVKHPLFKILIFVYGTKANWIRGFIEGAIRGISQCKDCRRRLNKNAFRTLAQGAMVDCNSKP